MIGPAGLQERPAYRRTLSKIHFSFFRRLEQSAPQVSPLIGETLIKRSTPP